MCKHAHARGVWGHALLEINFKLGALTSPLRPYMYPNVTSSTRVHGRSNTAIHHDTCRSSLGIIVDLGLMRWASYRRIDKLDENSF